MADQTPERKPRSMHQYNWLEIRRDHARGMTFSDIARKYKVRLQTITKRAKKEGWAQKNAQLAQEATRKALEAQADKVAEAVGSSLTEIISAVGPMVSTTVTKLNEVLARPIEPGAKSDASEYGRNLAVATSTMVDVVRALAGLTPGTPLMGEKSAGDEVFKFVVAPRKEQAQQEAS